MLENNKKNMHFHFRAIRVKARVEIFVISYAWKWPLRSPPKIIFINLNNRNVPVLNPFVFQI